MLIHPSSSRSLTMLYINITHFVSVLSELPVNRNPWRRSIRGSTLQHFSLKWSRSGQHEHIFHHERLENMLFNLQIPWTIPPVAIGLQLYHHSAALKVIPWFNHAASCLTCNQTKSGNIWARCELFWCDGWHLLHLLSEAVKEGKKASTRQKQSAPDEALCLSGNGP